MTMKSDFSGVEDSYRTTDIDVAATLLCKGYSLTGIAPLAGTKAAFMFENHPAIDDAVQGFWNNRIEVHPLEFSTYRKNLKSRIYAMNASRRR